MCFVGGCLNSYLCHYYIITGSRDRALVVRYAWAYLLLHVLGNINMWHCWSNDVMTFYSQTFI